MKYLIDFPEYPSAASVQPHAILVMQPESLEQLGSAEF